MWFALNVYMRQALTSRLQTPGSDLFYVTVQAPMSQWDKCWRVNGAYMEDWHVPSGTPAPHTHHNQNKVLGIGVFATPFLKTSLHNYNQNMETSPTAWSLPSHLHSTFKLPHTSCCSSRSPIYKNTGTDKLHKWQIFCVCWQSLAGLQDYTPAGQTGVASMVLLSVALHNKTNYKNIYFNSKDCLGPSWRFFILQQLCCFCTFTVILQVVCMYSSWSLPKLTCAKTSYQKQQFSILSTWWRKCGQLKTTFQSWRYLKCTKEA